ncbi:MAG: acyl-CoA dehydrogenase family protein [Deltaproteobacteria bacterium]|nr:acyl-CoA dehydrogenase family protein [Deltaproteobacteria bacterium]
MEEEKLEVHPGGSFLVQEAGSVRIPTPEGFSEEQRMYHRTATDFAKQQVEPLVERIEKKEPGLLRELLRKAGELGLLMVDIPEKHGGLGGDLTTSCVVAEATARNGSWSVTFGAHVGIGTLPIVYFGTDEQKARYLPQLATGEKVAAYALTEPGSGSDALGARTKAVLSKDQKHYVLTGSKQFITNAAFADVFIVFAKVDGEKFTGFIVERGTPGFTVNAEEHKMGIRGSSTCSLTFDDAPVPVENLLGEIGKGHKIAFNILNIGRLKLGVGVLGGMRATIERTLAYARDRKQFQTPIFEFPLIREKFARMSALLYANESMAYRTTGLIDSALAHLDRADPQYPNHKVQVVEEYALEASVLKVFGSEALGTVVDECVQVFGGYGFIEDYPAERAYRDARINRIFEGTNEINRMLVTGMLLKRSMKGQLPFLESAERIVAELDKGIVPQQKGSDALAHEAHTAELCKALAAVACKTAVEAFGFELEKHQEVLAAVSDIVMEAYAIESSVLRTRQAASAGQLDPVRVAMTQLYAQEGHLRAFERARRVVCAALQGQAAKDAVTKLQKLYVFEPRNLAELRETIVNAMASARGYPMHV